jgi:hypothetical protein
MFRHFSLRGMQAAIAAVKAALAAEGKPTPIIQMPEELIRKRRKGMSAKSGYAKQRGAKFRGYKYRRPQEPKT